MQSAKGYLEARGILPATIQTHVLEFDGAPSIERIVARLGENIQISGQPLSAYAKELLWIPYLNADGAVTSWTARIFPTPADPHPKFLNAKGSGNLPYVPPSVWAVADKPDVPIVLTEGPVKTLACIQAGHPTVGLNGVYGAGSRDAEDKIVLHPLLASFGWPKRSVLLAFDADILTKFDVRKALFRTFLILAGQQADVFTITSWDADVAKGVDDFLAKSENPAQELELLVKDAAPFVSLLEKTPADLRLVEEELKAVALPRLQRTQVVRAVAKAVGVTAKDLLIAISPTELEPGRGRVLKLDDETTPWDDAVDGEALVMDIYRATAEIVWLSKPARMTCAFWLTASFVFNLFRKFPYLRIKSADRNCGKSTLVDVLNEFVWNPILAVDVSPAALYRVAEEFQPTILLDEFDNPEQIRELTQLLNAGYDANRVAVRQNNDKAALEGFRTFCPKVIASIKQLHSTTESRCLPIDMQRVPPDEEKKLTELCDVDPAKFLAIKRKILAWVEDHREQIKRTRPQRPDWLKTRDWDLWRPLFTIAEVIGGKAPNWIQTASRELFEGRVVEQSLAIEILAHLRDAAKQPYIFIEPKKGKTFLPSEKVVDYCNGDLEASWVNWKSGKGEGLTVERLARELRQHFKVHSKRVGYQNKDVRGYWRKDLQCHFDSLLPPEDKASSPGSPEATEGHQEGSEDGCTATGTESDEKRNAEELPKNTPEPGGVGVRPSESRTSLRQVEENNLGERQVENSNLAELSGALSTGYENSAKSGPEIRGVVETLFLAIDVETSAELKGKGKVAPDALDPHKCELRILSAATPSGSVIVHDFRTGPAPDYLRAAIAETPLLVHGAAFDLAVLQANGYKTFQDVFCTLTASRLLTAGLHDSNDLGSVLKRHLGIELPKELGASDFGGMILTDEQLEYCRNDVRHLHRLQEALQNKLGNPVDEHGDGAKGVDLVRVAQLEMALIPLVVDTRLRGIKVDRTRLEQALTGCEARKKTMAAELRVDLRTPKLNLASHDQLLRALKACGLELPDSSKETLSAVAHPLAGGILRYRKLAELCKTLRGWLEDLDSDNRLYPPLNPLGAETGRFSCKKPNLLAVPRNSALRGCFIPDDSGLVLIEADYSNIEMRIAAFFAREERMLKVFRNGGDIHGETAERVLRDRGARQQAKSVNFGALYGGGAERLRVTARTEFGVELSCDQAQRYHQDFFSTYPNLRGWHQAARDAASELTYGASAYGRRRWADPEDRADRWDWNRFQLATNFEVQSAGADALKIALARLHPQFANGPTRILLPVHDSILLQTPADRAEEAAETVCHAMREAFRELLGDSFPVAVDHKISQRWGEEASIQETKDR